MIDEGAQAAGKRIASPAVEIEDLKDRLREAEETLDAIRFGEIDALIVETDEGQKTFTLSGADQIYRVLIDSMAEGALVLTPDGTVNYANAQLANLAGRPLNSIVGIFAKELFAESEQPAFAKLLLQAQVQPTGAEFNLSDGRYFFSVYVSASIIETSAGPVACLVVTDLREHKKNAVFEAVRESETQFRQLADSMPQIAWSAAPDGQIGYYNMRWTEFAGSGALSFFDCLHFEEAQEFKKAWADSLQDEKPFEVEHRLLDLHGHFRWHLTRALALRDSTGKITKWFGTSTDIQEQKIMQEALSRQAEELTRSNTELARFAFVASHDLKEPLRVVSSYAQMLRMKYRNRLDAMGDTYINFITDGVDRMYSLIEDLLSYSRIGATPDDLRRTDMNKIVVSAIANLETAINESGAEIVCRSDFPTLVVDPSQMVQLLQNLLSNAIKYRSKQKTPIISISASLLDGAWTFTVSDNGIGIETSYFEKIFQIFQRLHSKGEYAGTGIGLAVCKKIVERHQGSIWVESEVGQGSHFLFKLPDNISPTDH